MLHLQELYIDCCDGLEQIIGFAQEDENHYSLCWPKWKTLWIENCRSLKYVFPDTLSEALPQLECVYLKNCPHLVLIYNQTEGKDVTGNHILLNVPFLQNLSVINCPHLTCFVVQAQLEKLYLSNVTCRQLCNIDVLTLNQDYIIVGDHEEVFQVQGFFIDSNHFVHSKKTEATEGPATAQSTVHNYMFWGSFMRSTLPHYMEE
ncbi:hypothetical protein V6Z11_D05G413300 [Gossypium hirsutum]